ncbi:ATP synthase F1 subunit gamma [Candidatus Falkowbacteria bacterium HGW-Falkowbacteria-1]|uniref:ATP synthase gamma chain n=1 Tax=Candidatus Falkowbacteria bacterium HGW-Falkowbacteria-1 TaxID=2013768 RepID=A0A2N2E8I7_9BACT|nr:MAG: ATP synthase F1 subunit gamma [Candidatus Falkowbacteria bacterium HGW-Falkowbacteria-1]
MAKTKEIQRRIKSVNNTKKITKAMEMVAAAKMRKSVEAVLKTRTYANLAWTTILNISGASDKGEDLHPLLKVRAEIKRVGVILLSSNRGLCGSFNSNIINKAVSAVKKHGNIDTEFILLGRKGLVVNSRYGYKVAAEFDKIDFVSEIKEVMPIARLAINDFLSGKYDKIFVAYTDFISATNQVPRVKQILPVDIDAEDEYLGVVGKDEKVGTTKEYIADKEAKYLRDDGYKYIFTYEPSSEAVLDQMIPRLIEVQLFQALLESNASEHSVRMASMHQATEAANDIVDELVLFYNKARQAAITSEIAEISAGANALKN